ncbi:efflux RND transporter permease subunit [Paludibacter sp. 221]|uniref:efflux RND transporter permease subunit n=1 Tax=Paludibacter sp. 221 TaxID=2302939 RepID=UPI0013D6BBED|nr:efflux RND transporter permease subunit [Paludibacter sp. 221]NDV46517.1 efflux RND transporter permease subunit [Paludibacter sp. 221]
MKVSSFKIILLFVCLAIIGLAFLPSLPVKLSPSQNLPQVNVSFGMYGASPIVVEMEVTSKLEAMFSRMKGIRKINSSSWSGGGRITIELDKHTDPDAARFEAATIIRQTWPQLPSNVSYPYVSLSRSDNNSRRPFLSYTLVAPLKSIDIQQFAEGTIKPKLSPIKGIYQVNVSGAKPMEWQFEYDYKQLEVLGISTNDIQSALSSLTKKESLGMATTIEKSSGKKQRTRVSFAAGQQDISEETLRTLDIKKTDGRIIHLGDVVKIKRIESEPSSYYRINGLNTIYVSLIADEQANQLDLGNKVKKVIEQMQKDFPKGFDMQLTYDATEYITGEMNKIYFRTGLTVLILLLFVFVIYRDFKYIILVISSLTINIAIAFIFYYLFRLEIQLYSLAGITISLTLIIDNTIVMSDQIIHRGNKKAFLAILAATLTTIGSLSVILFLDERIRLNLKDFAAVIMINLSISLLTSLFLVPALIEKLKIKKYEQKKKSILLSPKKIFPTYKKKQWLVYFNHIYATISAFLWRWKTAVVILIIVAFGLPVFLLPDKIEPENNLTRIYNKTLGSDTYKEKIKPHVNNILGGTWRLFAQKVYNGSYWGGREEETMLNVTASLPHGSTLEQMNVLIQRMESYIAQFSEIRQFETHIMSANRASIGIRFTKENQKNSFPYQLKSKLISKSIELGGGSWTVYGVGDGFNNDVKEQAGSYRVEMFGFNYDELYVHAENFRKKLLEHRRIKNVDIKSDFSWFKEDYQEFRFDLKKDRMAKENIQPYQLYALIKPFFEKRIQAGNILYETQSEQLILKAKQSAEYNLWDLNHIPIQIGEKTFKLSDLASIEKYQAPQNISKENQQYRLCIQYEYIGAYEQGRRVLKRNIEEIQKTLPVGYTIKAEEHGWGGWGKADNKQYWLLALVFIIIYFCSSILFNSFKQPLYVIFVIPISFIGLFLTFYLFKLNFDQGGFAAFILLAGITVNTNIYIINEYNNIVKSRNIKPIKAYLKAWNAKVRPISLTIVSTILGFIPFIVSYKEGFWFPLAAGTIGGLIMSFIATFLFLPLFMGLASDKNKTAPLQTNL